MDKEGMGWSAEGVARAARPQLPHQALTEFFLHVLWQSQHRAPPLPPAAP